MYRVFTIYTYARNERYAPKGFKTSPSLEEYLNYLGDQGWHVISVLVAREVWYEIVATKED